MLSSVKSFPVGPITPAPSFRQATRKGNIGGNHDVVWLHVLDNPIIGRIKSGIYNLKSNPSFIWNAHPSVGHQGDIKAISACDAVHLLFDRARISIYKDVQQCNVLALTPDATRVPSKR